MIELLSDLTSGGYKHLAKPLLFKLKPDSVHDGLLKTADQVQKSDLLLKMIEKSWSYQNETVLQQEFHGVRFKNPIGLAAGFDKNIQTPKLMKAVGFGFMTGGSVTAETCAGNPKPWFYRLPSEKSLMVHAGLANQGVDAVLKRVKNYNQNVFSDFPLVLSAAKTNSPEAASESAAIEDYLRTIKLTDEKSAAAMCEINISCPNTYGGEPFNTPERLEKLLTGVDGLALKLPVFIKMPQDLDWKKFQSLLEIITRHNVQGVTIANLAKNRQKYIDKGILPAEIKGGLSGKPAESGSNQLIEQTYLNYGDKLTIIGVGGVFSAEDAYRKIKLGASLVELITGMIFNGPQIVGQINRGLVELLERDGYGHVSEAIGADVR